MAQYRITDTLLTRIADAVRRITGGTGNLSPATIADALEDDTIVKKSNVAVDLATPTISVSSAGLITATETQQEGYVAAGTKTSTRQLSVQSAQTITPGTASKTIASGRYLTGTQTILGDANLVSGNILNDVSIFGVKGSVVVQDFRTGTAEPSASLGANGDLYFMTEV